MSDDGFKNYVTPHGLHLLQREHDELWFTERPKVVEVVSWAAGNGDRSENGDYLYGKKRLREIDRRIRFLRKRLESAVVVDPARQAGLERVYFGATVLYANGRGEEISVTLVGEDEADMAEGKISWRSPVARALMKAEEGGRVKVLSPAGSDVLEVIEISYLMKTP
ncbi:MAG TPA: transcription elongation factor GreB [Rhodospirillaceae bacterium]|nr:transcription elongation factor GreB [Rhodospirillaceae bacterium]